MSANLSATTEFFSETAEPFAGNYQNNACFRDRLDLFRCAVQQSTPAGAGVLDFGCGPGVISLALAQLGYDVLGVDGAAGMVECARARAESINVKNARFEHVDVAHFNALHAAFDAVVCSSVIEYIEDDLALLEKLIESLRPGGHLIVSVPHHANIFAPVEPMAHRIKLRLSGQTNGHLAHTRHHYNRLTFSQQLRDMGLEKLRCTSFECPVLGDWGIKLSRWSFMSRMLLFQGRKPLSII
jgi:2-polyprenyl-3-methyl-5-hydroxy-6-metoxy-1,4-benzoquinol methylase